MWTDKLKFLFLLSISVLSLKFVVRIYYQNARYISSVYNITISNINFQEIYNINQS